MSFDGRKRKPPPAGRGKKRLPWSLRLIPTWKRQLVVRYFFATFSIIEKKMEAEGKTKYLAAAKSSSEVKALRSLRLLQVESSGKGEEVEEVRNALGTLRRRESIRRWED